MAGGVTVEFVWLGGEVAEKGVRASQRALAELGLNVALTAKELAYVRTGTNRRAITVAPMDANHDGDEEMARAGLDLLSDSSLIDEAPEAGIEVGSWTSYAILEELDRGRPFITPALEMHQDSWEELVGKYMQAEGLA